MFVYKIVYYRYQLTPYLHTSHKTVSLISTLKIKFFTLLYIVSKRKVTQDLFQKKLGAKAPNYILSSTP